MLEVLLNCVTNVLGPLNTDQAPVPTAGLLAARVAVAVVQIVCGFPALAVVGVAVTVMVTSEVDAEHGELETVQRKT